MRAGQMQVGSCSPVSVELRASLSRVMGASVDFSGVAMRSSPCPSFRLQCIEFEGHVTYNLNLKASLLTILGKHSRAQATCPPVWAPIWGAFLFVCEVFSCAFYLFCFFGWFPSGACLRAWCLVLACGLSNKNKNKNKNQKNIVRIRIRK